jgi:hypothetical protein
VEMAGGGPRFDADALLAAVDTGHPPSETRVFGAKRAYFFEQGCLFSFAAAVGIFILAIVGLVVVLGVQQARLTTPSAGTSSVYSGEDAWQWIVFGALFLLAFVGLVVACGARVMDAVRGLRSWRTQVLVLAPEGFVARTGTSPHAVFAVSYAELSAISLSIRHARYETITDLHLTYRRPTSGATATPRLEQVTWRVDPRFGPSAPIAQAILEAHARAVAAHSAAE